MGNLLPLVVHLVSRLEIRAKDLTEGVPWPEAVELFCFHTEDHWTVFCQTDDWYKPWVPTNATQAALLDLVAIRQPVGA